MERIAAAGNLIIEVQPERWRVLVNGGGTDRLLLEAATGEPLRYASAFATRRSLPPDSIPPAQIERVVLGWSAQDDSWHLGLVLNDALAAQRGTRWCGIAHWYDPDTSTFLDLAQHAGQSLAHKLERPFTLIPPQARAEDEDERFPIPQPAPPFKFDLWRLTYDRAGGFAGGLELRLSSAWGRQRLIRAAWQIVWLGVFIVLTVTTLTSGIALPRPEFLVYFGFASMGVLLITIMYNLYSAITRIRRIRIDANTRSVKWMRGRRVVREAYPQGVYASHIVGKVGRGRRNPREERSVQHGEINLFMGGDIFEPLVVVTGLNEKIPTTDDPIDDDAVVPLDEFNARTSVQSAALLIARTLKMPAWYDKRVK